MIGNSLKKTPISLFDKFKLTVNIKIINAIINDINFTIVKLFIKTFFIDKIKKTKIIIGIILTPNSISCICNWLVTWFIVSELNLFIFGKKNNDFTVLLNREIKFPNKRGGYSLVKLDIKANAALIFEDEIIKPRNKEISKL